MTVYDPPPGSLPQGVEVRQLFANAELGLHWELLTGEGGLTRKITHSRIQKSGLALVGHMHGFVPSRIQILGETELSFLEGLSPETQHEAAQRFFAEAPSCVIVSRGVRPPEVLIEAARRADTPLILVREKSSVAITAVHTLLDEHLAPRCRIHGVLVDIFEVGVLICGQSGIGKSETSLELVMRGHRLVADDVVECDYRPPGMIFGEPANPLRHFMEVRGLGILNIKDLYGVTAVRDRKRIDLIVDLELWKEGAEYDRIGVEDEHRDVLGVPIRKVTLPIQPGRNMSSIIEIAARAELLRRAGHHPAREFVDQIERATMHGSRTPLPKIRPPRSPNESSAPPPVRLNPAGPQPGLQKPTEEES
ncbi:MAG: HPr(Ser) kinase/phosphatase [Polyangiaceae bacterium]|nr:HPr(Ser) kinase/phosphatase [Polyangiaceae bacterium]